MADPKELEPGRGSKISAQAENRAELIPGVAMDGKAEKIGEGEFGVGLEFGDT